MRADIEWPPPDQLRLEHFASEPTGTWSRLYVPGIEEILFAVSPPWIYNRPFVSRIPVGLYNLERHDSESHRGSWAFVGGSVRHRESDPGRSRYSCLLHAANFPRELSGCTAPGSGLASLAGEMGVTNSRDTLAALGEVLEQMESPKIEVVSLAGGG